ncbi:MAG: cobalamin B12-binding domain-containing protein [Ignavibacteria bacterium]|nr:MAG: cobalamin B12-binding domain-containing protein [Ignavibacteria bacterium]
MAKKIRVVIAKVGLDGHDRGAKVIAAALRDAGMEVIYTGLRKTPETVVEAALQEDADVIGVSLLSGAHMTIFPRILALMKSKKHDHVLLFGGGIIPDQDIADLKRMGVGVLFTPGASTLDIVKYVKDWVAKNRAD